MQKQKSLDKTINVKISENFENDATKSLNKAYNKYRNEVIGTSL